MALTVSSLIFAFAFAFLLPLADLLVVVAGGQHAHTPAKLPEVDLIVPVFIQHFHGLLDVVRINLGLKNR